MITVEEKPKFIVLVHGNLDDVRYDWLQKTAAANNLELEIVSHVIALEPATADTFWFDECASVPTTIDKKEKPHHKFTAMHPWERRKKR